MVLKLGVAAASRRGCCAVYSRHNRGADLRPIAEKSVLSPGTVTTHLGRIMSKLDERDRVQLAVLPYELSMVTPGSLR